MRNTTLVARESQGTFAMLESKIRERIQKLIQELVNEEVEAVLGVERHERIQRFAEEALEEVLLQRHFAGLPQRERDIDVLKLDPRHASDLSNSIVCGSPRGSKLEDDPFL